MRLDVQYSTTIPDKQDFFDLYKTTGWQSIIELGEDQLLTGINNSWFMVSALIEGKLVGFGRVISDGVFQAFICDLIVGPKYQKQGIGGSLLKEMLNKCAEENMISVQISLVCIMFVVAMGLIWVSEKEAEYSKERKRKHQYEGF